MSSQRPLGLHWKTERLGRTPIAPPVPERTGESAFLSPPDCDSLCEDLEPLLERLDDESLLPQALPPLEERDRVARRTLSPEALLAQFRADDFDHDKMLAFCQEQLKQDRLFDVKLARLLPHRHGDPHNLPIEQIIRIMGVLDLLSPGPRLIMVVGHLAQHSDPRIASKAVLLLGRRLRSREWIDRFISSPNPRIRANLIESLWGSQTALVHKLFRSCLKDANNRVVGNALVGLHLMGQAGIDSFVQRMLHDTRPLFRQTAAWVMSRLGKLEYIPHLERAENDPNGDVRASVQRALNILRPPPPPPPVPVVKPETPAQIPASLVDQPVDRRATDSIEAALAALDLPPRPAAFEPPAAPVALQPDPAPAEKPAEEPAEKTEEFEAPMFQLRLDGRYRWGD